MWNSWHGCTGVGPGQAVPHLLSATRAQALSGTPSTFEGARRITEPVALLRCAMPGPLLTTSRYQRTNSDDITLSAQGLW